jgi:hypothetical protein
MVLAWFSIVLVAFFISIYPAVAYNYVMHEIPPWLALLDPTAVLRSCSPPLNDSFPAIYKWVDFCVVVLVPMILTFVSNIVIVVLLRQAEKRRSLSLSVRGRGSTSSSSRASSVRNIRSVTIMLVFLGVVFVLTTLPRSAYFLYITESPNEDFSKMALFHNATYLIYCTSNAINFALYCLSGSRFRLAMRSLFCGQSRRKRHSTAINMSRDVRTATDRKSSEGQTQVTALL